MYRRLSMRLVSWMRTSSLHVLYKLLLLVRAALCQKKFRYRLVEACCCGIKLSYHAVHSHSRFTVSFVGHHQYSCDGRTDGPSRTHLG